MRHRELGEGLRRRMPSEVRWIAGVLEDAGFEAWVVGGVVRDAVLGLPGGDWDLATRARPGDVQRLFPRTVPLGIEYGTVGVLGRSGTLHEVTTFRRDVETFGRRAVVAFADRIEEDLSRRDFTINAIAWNPATARVLDPSGGIDDLAIGRLMTVGSASDRFAEDHLRILRALRFAGRFGLAIDPEVFEAARAGRDQLLSLSPERVRDELLKVLSGDDRPSGSLDLYRRSGALEVLVPELVPVAGALDGAATGPSGAGRIGAPGSGSDRSVPRGTGAGPDSSWSRALAVVDGLSRRRPLLRLAAILMRARPPAEAVLVRLRFSNADADRVSLLVRAGAVPPNLAEGDQASARRWLVRLGRENLRDAARIWIAEARAARGTDRVGDPAGDPMVDPAVEPPVQPAVLRAVRRLRAESAAAPVLSVAGLAVDGRDLMAIGIPAGPRIGGVLRELLDRVIDAPELNERETLLRFAAEAVEANST